MPKRHCKVSDDYFKEFPSIKKGKTDDEVCCEICNCYINITHKGKKDIVNHNETNKHKKNLRGQSETSGLQNFGVLEPHSLKFINKQLNEILYVGVSTDASNHNSVKMFPILIQYFDQHSGMKIKVVDLQSITGETSEMVSEMLISSLEKLKLTEKCIAFSGDNCNTNFGGMRRTCTNNIFFRLKAKFNEKLVGVGCPAHILNNTIHTCCDSLPFADLESIVFKIFNYFNIYTVRVASLREFCDFVGSGYQQLLPF
ncbi:hypothetical protein RN001_003449 [Aquatica leii]|uniref:DUF4371 domain-containing protein n=1 Tax=Aquatica leii TaxID=1421715 RepID=A0AAN7QP44_9COLE|nr:hypothetical protein RN001_003449 [Aquatica leii]